MEGVLARQSIQLSTIAQRAGGSYNNSRCHFYNRVFSCLQLHKEMEEVITIVAVISITECSVVYNCTKRWRKL